MIVWGLFDSGNGSYYNAAKKIGGDLELYSVGLDKKNKNDHFISLDLADYSYHFTGVNKIFETLDELPKPDLIIASPPCEAWSVASSMKGGNANWKQEKGDGLFEPQIPLSRFTIRDYVDYERYQFYPDRQLITRINGELTAFHTVEIIKRYHPRVFIIENPAHGRLWEYIEKILGFSLPYENLTYYNNYDYPIKKPTKFASNINLELKREKIKNEVKWENFSGDYNERSNIPEKLVIDIFSKVKEMINCQPKNTYSRYIT